MGMPIIPKLIGRRRSQWMKMIIFVVLGFGLFFEPLYNLFFGKILTFSIMGLRLPAYALAILIWIFAYDAKQIG